MKEFIIPISISVDDDGIHCGECGWAEWNDELKWVCVLFNKNESLVEDDNDDIRWSGCFRAEKIYKSLKFDEHLEKVSREVDKWPEWKKNIIGTNSKLLKIKP